MLLLYSVSSWFSRLILGVSMLALFAIPFIMTFDIMSRLVFNRPTIWSLEISILLFQAVVFLPLGPLVLEGRHLRVTFLTDLLPHWSKALSLFGLGAIALFACFMTYHGLLHTHHAWAQGQISPSLLGMPLWISYVFIPVGGLILLVSAVSKAIFVTSGDLNRYSEFLTQEEY